MSLGAEHYFFGGGAMQSMVNNGFEALTGNQTIASRNKSEIADLGEKAIIERDAKRISEGS